MYFVGILQAVHRNSHGGVQESSVATKKVFSRHIRQILLDSVATILLILRDQYIVDTLQAVHLVGILQAVYRVDTRQAVYFVAILQAVY